MSWFLNTSHGLCLRTVNCYGYLSRVPNEGQYCIQCMYYVCLCIRMCMY